LVTVRSRQGETVDLFEARDLFQCFPGEGLFSLEGVQANALEQVAKPEVGVFGKAFQHLEQSHFHANSGLNAVDLNHEGILCDVAGSSGYQGTWVVIAGASQASGDGCMTHTENYANSLGTVALYDETITVAFLELIHEH
jgi:hypothetical protein